MIVDSAIIEVRSGRGGSGAVSFRREKYIPKGGPDGGDGGHGGSVVLVADPSVQTLLDFAGRHHWHADAGQPGRAKQQIGKSADDLAVGLAVGTLVYDADTGELVVDLDKPGKRLVVAQGGKGGFGNERFKSATHQTPRESTPGEPGRQRTLRLELKLVADIGLVGLPNAGKSTLLSRVSRATPKVADYPFTTLEPQLGIAEVGGGGETSGERPALDPKARQSRLGGISGRRVVIADLPGLIAEAHAGAGLGTRFLRHVERTRMLVHVLDAVPLDGSAPVDNYRTIRAELERYTPADAAEGGVQLTDKTQFIALSKMDLIGDEAERAAAVGKVEAALGSKVYPISSATGEGLSELLQACWSHLQSRRESEGELNPEGWGR